MMSRGYLRVSVLVLLALAGAGCSGRPFGLEKVEPTEGRPDRAVKPETLQEETVQTLRQLDLLDRLDDSPLAIAAILNALHLSAPRDDLLTAEAEILYRLGAMSAGSDPEAAADWYLLSAARSYEYLFAAQTPFEKRVFDSRFEFTRQLYNYALGHYLDLLNASGGALGDHQRDTAFESVRVQVETGEGLLDPADFDSMLVSRNVELKGLNNRYRRDGVGAALVEFESNNRRTDSLDRYRPPQGSVRPATAVLRFGPIRGRAGARRRGATLAIYDAWETAEIEVRGLSVPLEADFSSPFAYLASLSPLTGTAYGAMLRPERFEGIQGMYMLTPYSPEKTPILLIHGLRSTALAWMELVNELLGDPELRDRIQIWTYAYPTGPPYLYNAQHMRRTLTRFRSALDPEGDAAAMASLVVVAHSMGGLLARTLVSDSGDSVWDSSFLVPPDELEGRADDIDWIRRLFYFEPKPFVDRVVFISTPHRGSQFAESMVGKLGSSLVELPERFSGRIRRVTDDNQELITPGMLEVLSKGGATSIRALRPEHPVLRAMAELPIEESVGVHTILGNRGKPDEKPISDGFVTYDSAHLSEADSELIVPSGHNTYEHPKAIAEVKRILREHLGMERTVGEALAPSASSLEPSAPSAEEQD